MNGGTYSFSYCKSHSKSKNFLLYFKFRKELVYFYNALHMLSFKNKRNEYCIVWSGVYAYEFNMKLHTLWHCHALHASFAWPIIDQVRVTAIQTACRGFKVEGNLLQIKKKIENKRETMKVMQIESFKAMILGVSSHLKKGLLFIDTSMYLQQGWSPGYLASDQHLQLMFWIFNSKVQIYVVAFFLQRFQFIWKFLTCCLFIDLEKRLMLQEQNKKHWNIKILKL